MIALQTGRRRAGSLFLILRKGLAVFRRIHKGLTLVEVLLLIIVILLALILLTISAGTCNGNDFTTRCAANMRGIGQAMYIYAQDDPQVFPAMGGQSADGLMRIFDPIDRVTPPFISGVPSPTVDLWTFVRTNYTTPDKFICPWTSDEPDPAQLYQDYYDFLSAANLSYAYQYQHDPDRRIIGTSSEPSFPFFADSNPYIKGGVTDDFYDDRLSDEAGNSTNHRVRERGQNVLFQDGHVELKDTPGVGLFGPAAPELGGFGLDNIYTVFESGPAVLVDPGSAAPTSSWCNLGGRSDACLVP